MIKRIPTAVTTGVTADANDRKVSRISMRGTRAAMEAGARSHEGARPRRPNRAECAETSPAVTSNGSPTVPAYYPRTVIFHASDLMTVVEHGAAGRRRTLDGNDAENPGVGEIITTSAFPSVELHADL